MNSNMREQQNKLPALKAADYGHSVVQPISESVCHWTADQWTPTWENSWTNCQPWKQLTMATVYYSQYQSQFAIEWLTNELHERTAEQTANLESSWLWQQCTTVNIRVSLPLNGWPMNSNMREQLNKLPTLKAADYAHRVVQSISESVCHWMIDQWTLTWDNSRNASLESSYLCPQCNTVNIRVSLPLNSWPMNSNMREQLNKQPALKAADYGHSVVQSISESVCHWMVDQWTPTWENSWTNC